MKAIRKLLLVIAISLSLISAAQASGGFVGWAKVLNGAKSFQAATQQIVQNLTARLDTIAKMDVAPEVKASYIKAAHRAAARAVGRARTSFSFTVTIGKTRYVIQKWNACNKHGLNEHLSGRINLSKTCGWKRIPEA